MSSESPIFRLFLVIGWVFGYTAAAILLLSLAALVIRRRRRVFIASVSKLSWIIVATGAMCGLAYVAEGLIACLGGNPYERLLFLKRISGNYAWSYWLHVFADVIAPQLFWFRRFRTNACVTLALSTAIVAPANIERMIVHFTSQSDFIPGPSKP